MYRRGPTKLASGASQTPPGARGYNAPLAMDFQILGTIREIKTIARGRGVRVRKHLSKAYGRGSWRKLKGVAEVMYPDGSIWLAELHWFEAHGIGRRDVKIKCLLHQL